MSLKSQSKSEHKLQNALQVVENSRAFNKVVFYSSLIYHKKRKNIIKIKCDSQIAFDQYSIEMVQIKFSNFSLKLFTTVYQKPARGQIFII